MDQKSAILPWRTRFIFLCVCLQGMRGMQGQRGERVRKIINLYLVIEGQEFPLFVWWRQLYYVESQFLEPSILKPPHILKQQMLPLDFLHHKFSSDIAHTQIPEPIICFPWRFLARNWDSTVFIEFNAFTSNENIYEHVIPKYAIPELRKRL